MSEKMKPERVVSTLNEYFSQMIDIVFKYNGTLDKIIGDELMIVYGAPIAAEDDTHVLSEVCLITDDLMILVRLLGFDGERE